MALDALFTLLWMVLGLVPAAVIATGSAAQRRFALLLAAATLPAPLLSTLPAPLRAVLAISAAWATLRIWELGRFRLALSPAQRIQRVLSFIDPQRVRRVRPALLLGQLARVAIAVGGMLLGWQLAFSIAPTYRHDLAWALRWAGGALLAYALTDAVYAGITLLARGAGRAVPVLHRDPLAARSVGEFWLRWNTTVGDFLRTRLFGPLARRGWPRAGVALGFAVSALFHAYVGLAALGASAATWMLLYFALQALLIAIERTLELATWPRPLAHIWVILAMLAPSPLFVEPLLRVCA